MSSDLTIYTKLSIQHFKNSVPGCVPLPIPSGLPTPIPATFLLRNPRFSNHFLNGCYVILYSSAEPLPIRRLLSFLGTSLGHVYLSYLQQYILLKPHLPLRLWTGVLGWPFDLASESKLPETWSSEGTSLVLSISSRWDRFRAFMACYATLLRTRSRMVNGDGYFISTYPAKANLVAHETTFAWVCHQTDKPVGYVQFTHLIDRERQLHVLITGLAVEEGFCRRSFERAMILHVIAGVPVNEIWVEVQEDNDSAKELYIRCGFVLRKKQATLTRRVSIS